MRKKSVKSPYGAGEMNLPAFLGAIGFFKPNSGVHQHFWFKTKSFSDGSNLLYSTLDNVVAMSEPCNRALFDALTGEVYAGCHSGISQFEHMFGAHINHISTEELDSMVSKKEFIDDFRTRSMAARPT